MIIDTKPDYIIYQTDDKNGVPEQAIFIKAYDDVVTMGSGENQFNVNYESFGEVIEVLKAILKSKRK